MALPRLSRQHRQLGLSLVMNLLTRVPGLAGILLLLPRMKAGIGIDNYSILMAATALGGSISFVMGGFALIGRRLVGEAFGMGDQAGEAAATRSLVDVASLGFMASTAIIIGYSVLRGSSMAFCAIAVATSFATLSGQADIVRAAYNEHYVTATALIVAQTLVYIAAFALPTMSYTIWIAAGVILAPQVLASIFSGAHLVVRRPYLLRGRPSLRRKVASQGLILGFGEGLLMSSLGFVTVYLEATDGAVSSAWYATTLRLFTTVLTPVVLILLPVSSYLRVIWHLQTPARQRFIIKLTLIGTIVYSVAVGAIMIVLSRLYVTNVLHLAMPGTLAYAAAVFMLFTAVVAFRAYTSIALVLLDSKKLSIEIATLTLISMVGAAVFATLLSPQQVVGILCVLLTASISWLIWTDARRFNRISRAAAKEG